MWWSILVVNLTGLKTPRKLIKRTSGCVSEALVYRSGNWVGKTCCECGRHHPIGWGHRLNKTAEVGSTRMCSPDPSWAGAFLTIVPPVDIRRQILQSFNTDFYWQFSRGFQSFSLELGWHHWFILFWGFQLLGQSMRWFLQLCNLQMVLWDYSALIVSANEVQPLFQL